jgi:phospholipid/cholesterol/gamma-HCH transport system permease protein
MDDSRVNSLTAGTRSPSWVLQVAADRAELQLVGDWSASFAEPSSVEILERLASAGPVRHLTVSGRDIRAWNTRLAALLFGLRRSSAQRRITTEFVDLPAGLARMVALAGAPVEPVRRVSRAQDLFVSVGEYVLRGVRAATDACASVGGLVVAALAVARGRGRLRRGDTSYLVRSVGADALGIVALANFLVGVILAFVAAVQLEQFGTEIYVANLVGIATAREMAAIITAVVLAGRTGAAFASEIAAMQSNEEVDALRALGVSPHEYLMLPRVFALLVAMPLLYLYACAIGMLGGLTIAVGMLDVTATAYIEQTRGAIGWNHFAIGAVKSLCFGALVGIVGCHIGLRARRSAADVGRAATSAVVFGILGIITIDAVFAVCAEVLDL